MLVDYERVVQRLRQEMVERQGIGRDGLYALIARLEVECAVEEGLPERALRLYGVALSDDLITSGLQPAPDPAHAPGPDGSGAAPSIAARGGTKEHTHGSRNSRSASRAPVTA